MATEDRGRDRLYFREDRNAWYMDLRDLGHGQKACVPPGEKIATPDRDRATIALGRALERIHAEQAGEELDDPQLGPYVEHHLQVKAGYRKASTVARDRQSLEHVLAWYGADYRLSEVTIRSLTEYVAWRRRQPGLREGDGISAQTVLHELHALSSLFKRAVAEGVAEENPVRRLPEKPTVRREEATWLEPGEAARLLKAAAAHDVTAHQRAVTFLHPLLATFLLTGGRKAAVLGLLRRDVDFRREVVHFRPNDHRGLKTKRSKRWVPLWPQLREILRDYLEREPRDPGELLFPSPATGRMLTSVRKSLEAAVRAAGISKRVTAHTLRHTYAASRVQTVDNGAPVPLLQVARELGHKGIGLIEDRYGHLQHTRARAEVVAYREGEVVGAIGPAPAAPSGGGPYTVAGEPPEEGVELFQELLRRRLEGLEGDAPACPVAVLPQPDGVRVDVPAGTLRHPHRRPAEDGSRSSRPRLFCQVPCGELEGPCRQEGACPHQVLARVAFADRLDVFRVLWEEARVSPWTLDGPLRERRYGMS